MNPVASAPSLFAAAFRGRASARPDPVCHDPWASALAGDEGAALARRLEERRPHLELWLAVRTAFIDRRLAAALGPGGARQVVVLGAGLDTRAARMSRPGVRFFEVDRGEIQEDKRRRLAALRGYPADAAICVPCDFEREDFLDRLIASGFDPAEPAFILWEGVTYYLTGSAVRATLGCIACGCHPRSTVIFDHLGERVGEPADRSESRGGGERDTRHVVSELGEPVRWGTDHALPMLYEEGFRRVRMTTFDEAALELTGTYERERRWRFIHLVEASVARDGV